MKKLIVLSSSISILCAVIFLHAAYGKPAEEPTVIKTDSGAVKIILPPDGWEKQGEDRAGAVWTKSDPYGLFAVAISSLKYISSDCNAETFQRQFLAKVKESLGGNEADFEENTPYFNVPTLIYTREVPADAKNKIRKIRDIYFLKDCKYYNITFGCDKRYFSKQWKDMEIRIKNTVFLDE